MRPAAFSTLHFRSCLAWSGAHLLPHNRFSIATYYVLASAEASSNLIASMACVSARGGEEGWSPYRHSRTKGLVTRSSAEFSWAPSFKCGLLRCLLRKGSSGPPGHPRGLREGLEDVDFVVSLTADDRLPFGAKADDPLSMYLRHLLIPQAWREYGDDPADRGR